MKHTLAKRGAIGLSAVVATAALVVVPALTASAAIVPTVGSAHPMYLVNIEDGSSIAAGTVLHWDDDILGDPQPSDLAFEHKFAVPAGAMQVKTFISPRGQETTYSAWNAYGSLGLTAGGILTPNLKPSGNTVAGQGSPSGSGAIANAGGDYSLGIAFFGPGSSIIEANYTYITVTANTNPSLATWTFDTPVTAPVTVAPAITTQPTDKNVIVGQTATFSAAASGTPAPDVKWQSSTDGTTYTDIAGATSASYTTSALAVADSGKKFRAVFTNTAGTATTNAATLTVTDTTPVEPNPTDNAATQKTVADPAVGVTTVTTNVGTSYAGQNLQAWGWSTPTNLGQPVVSPTGDVTINIAGLPAGAHTIAVTLPNSSTVIAWFTITIPALTYGPQSDTVGLKANVKASDLWALAADYLEVNFNDVTRGASVTRDLGKVTVTDDRNVLKGWTLTAAWPAFTHGADTSPATALTYTPKPFGSTALPAGITTGALGSTTGSTFAESAVGISTGAAGVPLAADMTFTAPANANAGLYTSTLTLTLTSK